MSSDPSAYRPIADYGLIGDCHAAALVSREGSIDWCCLPRFDSDACFARLLDARCGGHFSIAPTGPFSSRRTYLPGSLVLATTFETPAGRARLIDFFAMREGGRRRPRRELVRIVEGLDGALPMRIEIAPRLDTGEVAPWIRPAGPRAHLAVGSSTALLISGDAPLEPDGAHCLAGEMTVSAGRRLHVAMQFVSPEELSVDGRRPRDHDEIGAHLDETLAWWRRWTSRVTVPETPGACIARSAIVLKALTYAPTGAIVAAPTTSLPEASGGERNWDYRFSWIRDSVFTVSTLAALGCVGEADAFRRFIQRSAAGSAGQLQVLFGVDGKRRLTEIELPHLEGWRGARPVRIGNAAWRQFQSDRYGMLLELTWRWSARGNAIEPHAWGFLAEMVEAAAKEWPSPDRGIWEVRGSPCHFVHSKVMCWAALHRGIALAERHGLPAPLERWRAARDAIRAAVERDGFDAARGVFVARFGARDLDAALLLLPAFDFVDWRDPRMVATAEAIAGELDGGDGLVRRYRAADGLAGDEGVFLPCTFWLAETFAHQGRLADARRLFARAAGCANELGLFAEEYAPAAGEMLGNFPQGLTHLAHIAAALAIDQAAAQPQPSAESAESAGASSAGAPSAGTPSAGTPSAATPADGTPADGAQPPARNAG